MPKHSRSYGETPFWYFAKQAALEKISEDEYHAFSRALMKKLETFPLDGKVVIGTNTVRQLKISGARVVYVLEPDHIALLWFSFD